MQIKRAYIASKLNTFGWFETLITLANPNAYLNAEGVFIPTSISTRISHFCYPLLLPRRLARQKPFHVCLRLRVFIL